MSSDGELGRLHTAAVREVFGEAVLAIRGEKGALAVRVPEERIAELQDTVDEMKEVYEGETDETLLGETNE